MPGALALAQRDYRAERLVGTIVLSFVVVEFDTAEHAEAAVRPVVKSFQSDTGLRDLAPTSVPTIRDSTVAYTGDGTAEGRTFGVAVLAVRDDRHLHAWIGVGLGASPLSDLLTVAERVFAARPTTEATPGAAGLRARLPDRADLPPGFTLESEDAEDADAAPATPPA